MQKIQMLTPSTNLNKIDSRKLSTALPGLGGGGRGRKSGGFNVGNWFYKKHPVATIEQNLRTVLGGRDRISRLPRRKQAFKTVKLGKSVTVKIGTVKSKSKRKKKR